LHSDFPLILDTPIGLRTRRPGPVQPGRLETATRILTDDQLADYGPWFGNHKRLRKLIAELEELSLASGEANPRWNR
jgi:hypothetical protein